MRLLTMTLTAVMVGTCASTGSTQELAGRQRDRDLDSLTLMMESEKQKGYEEGCREAEADIARHAVAFYSFGLTGHAGWHDSTGFPSRPGIGCVVTPEFLGRAEGYADCVRKWIDANGIPSWSRQKWLELLRSPQQSFATFAQNHAPVPVPHDSALALVSPDRRWRIYSTRNSVESSELLVICDSTGAKLSTCQYGYRGPWDAEICWGPDEADVVVLRTTMRDDDAGLTSEHLTVIDLRTGYPTSSH